MWAKVTGKFDALIAGAPEALDTLKEIADKLGDDDAALAGLLSAVAGKANAADVYTKSEIGDIVDDAEDWIREQLAGKQGNRLVVTVTQSGTDLVADVAVSDIIQAISAGRDVLAVYGIGGRLTEYYKVEGYNQQTRTLVWGLARGIGIKTLSQTGASVTLESKTFAEAAELAGKQDVSPITNAASGALVVNEYRDFGTVSALTVTLTGGTMTNYDLYKFAFTCASDNTTLTLPSGIKLPVDMEMEMATGRRFECVIDYANCLTFNCWD
ncbi:MAG: hypothetical protein IJ724_01250 [Muribaculaceae bacterium]|nr:hypothetical protein [Muribaculaceae bacterium]